MFMERLVGYKLNMTSFKGQAGWAKMMSPGGKVSALGFHPTKKVNKAEYLTYISTSIWFPLPLIGL